MLKSRITSRGMSIRSNIPATEKHQGSGQGNNFQTELQLERQECTMHCKDSSGFCSVIQVCRESIGKTSESCCPRFYFTELAHGYRRDGSGSNRYNVRDKLMDQTQSPRVAMDRKGVCVESAGYLLSSMLEIKKVSPTVVPLFCMGTQELGQATSD